MTASDLVGLESVALTIAGHTARLDLPVGWLLDPGPPVVAIPPSWDGDLPGVVVSIEHDAVRGEALAAAVTAAALSRLGDPVIVSMTLHGSHAGSDDSARDDDHNGADVEIVVAHQHRGVDVTTVERHHCRPGPVRWVVGFTLAHPDVPRLLPLARRVVASLRTTS
jgi:hypothetical protein